MLSKGCFFDKIGNMTFKIEIMINKNSQEFLCFCVHKKPNVDYLPVRILLHTYFV